MDILDTKEHLIRLITEQLTTDLELFCNAAKRAHKASIDEENQPDNKYDTLALEASYVAQGQANRAQELRRSIEIYKQVVLPRGNANIRLLSLVTQEDDAGDLKRVFIGPVEGGRRITTKSGNVMVITPASPLGNALIGKTIDDSIDIKIGESTASYLVIEIA
ncbi:MAG: GreA/GreB family elongation factor [Desulfuromonadaceae bacterium]|nr:GreA/GreB family elongation factor [Desulfuromonadaceae bacterium]MDD5105451.1 GreA/GreB family elongation factor [Desulfuromonadaceae bacterium]